MSEPSSLQGLSCPNCGGIVPVPEGQLIVKCPYCDLRSMVRGERGLLRYQVPQQVDRENASASLKKFLSSSMAIAPAAKTEARLAEILMVYLPFWTIWERLAAWVFGEKKVGSGDDAHYEPREVRILQDLTWNGAAADVGEFGVTRVPPVDQNLDPFDSEVMHARGMVFEPVGSFSDANQSATAHFESHVERSAHLDRIGQIFSRPFRRRNALVYHPLWVLRYLFRNRSFQVVVDGYTGKILYGKAPGNTLYRAAVLILGMAFGAFLSIDIPALILINSDSGDVIWPALLLFAAGLGIMLAAYRKFRRGEQYEFRLNPPEQAGLTGSPLEMITSVRDVEKWIDRLS
jgi:hypothetical protein